MMFLWLFIGMIKILYFSNWNAGDALLGYIALLAKAFERLHKLFYKTVQEGNLRFSTVNLSDRQGIAFAVFGFIFGKLGFPFYEVGSSY